MRRMRMHSKRYRFFSYGDAMLLDRAHAMTTPRVRRLPANRQGRDFVIGDLRLSSPQLQHCCSWPALTRLLAIACCQWAIWSIAARIQLGCLELLRQSWFHTVLGNHEQMLLDALADPGMGRSQAFPVHALNGGEWASDMILHNAPRLLELAALVRDMPHVLVVGEVPAANIVHAQYSPAWSHRANISMRSWTAATGGTTIIIRCA